MRARVVVTRAREDAAPWIEALEKAGFDAMALPCLETRVLDDEPTRERLAAALDGAAWLALTSAKGVSASAALLGLPLPARVRVAAVGETTADAARRALGRVDLVSSKGHGRHLAELLAEDLADAEGSRRVVAASADRAQTHLEEVLGPRGIEVVRVPVYRTVVAAARAERDDLARQGVAAVLIASPSAVEGLLNVARVDPGVAVVTIGPTSTKAARSRGLAVVAQAARPDLPSMIRALEGALEELPGGKRS